MNKNYLITELNKIALCTEKGISIVNISDIVYCEAYGDYVKIHFEEDKNIISCITLKALEKKLNDEKFFRIHKSFLINLIHLNEYIKKGNGRVVLKGGIMLDIAQRKKQDFVKFLIDTNTLLN